MFVLLRAQVTASCVSVGDGIDQGSKVNGISLAVTSAGLLSFLPAPDLFGKTKVNLTLPGTVGFYVEVFPVRH